MALDKSLHLLYNSLEIKDEQKRVVTSEEEGNPWADVGIHGGYWTACLLYTSTIRPYLCG